MAKADPGKQPDTMFFFLQSIGHSCLVNLVRALRYKRSDLGVYFLRTRLTDGLVGWTEEERAYFWSLVGRVAEFSGIKLLDGAVLDREVCLLVEVDPTAGGSLEDRELVRRYRQLYDDREGFLGLTAADLESRLADGGSFRESLRGRLLARMHDISPFMKTLKQRFAVWYNCRHERKGTLWRDRFESSLVQEGSRIFGYYRAFVRTASVRAGLAKAPQEYRWSTAWRKDRWWEVLSPRQVRLLAELDGCAQQLLAAFLRPQIGAKEIFNGRSPGFWPRWPEFFCRGGVMGEESFVRYHTEQWTGRQTAISLKELAEDAQLCAGRSVRRR